MSLTVKDADGMNVDLQAVTIDTAKVVVHANPSGYIVDETGSVRNVIRENVIAEGEGTNELVAAPGNGFAIRVLSLLLIAQDGIDVYLKSGDGEGETALLANDATPLKLGEVAGFALQRNDHGWFQTEDNEALNLDLSADNIPVVGLIQYVVVEAV